MNYNNQLKGKIKLIEETLSKKIIEELIHTFMAFDVETTGFSCYNDFIVELGAVLFVNQNLSESFSSLVNPHCTISSQVTKVNHITNQMIKSADDEEIVYARFVQFFEQVLNGQVIVCAHNANFDMRFLAATLERLGYSGTIRYIDTLKLAKRSLCLENYKLNTVAEYYHLVNHDAHRAAADALVCGEILVKLLHNLI